MPAAFQPPALESVYYPALGSEPERRAVLDAYLEAWRRRETAPAELTAGRQALLAVYATAYRGHLAGDAPSAALDERLRVLWDLCGVAHATLISPDEIKGATGWREPPALTGPDTTSVTLTDLAQTTLLAPLERLPAQTRLLLANVRLDSAGQESAATIVSQAARAVYFSGQLPQWSPSCPLEVCGSCEPLTRTLILAPVGNVDLAPKPDWSLAAVAVHEAAHIAWFYRPEVSRDPRLLLVVPNEREAWRLTAQFLRGLLRCAVPEVRAHVQTHGAAVREMLQRARDQVGRANRVLGLPPQDESLQLALPQGATEDALRVLRQ
jgi:hypothetical protein